MDYLIRSVDNHSIQRHILSVDTFMVESTVLAIGGYLANDAQYRPVRTAVAMMPEPAGYQAGSLT